MTAHQCMRRGHWVYLTVLLLVYINSVQALNCYVCNSTLDDNCNAKFEKTDINPIKPEPCNVYNAKYCIKVYGMWGGVVGTHRFCSSRDMGEQCQDICDITDGVEDCNESIGSNISGGGGGGGGVMEVYIVVEEVVDRMRDNEDDGDGSDNIESN
ncbi:Hypothetical predicted protein [Octopus vulgaris]|uniref:Protein sleepless n=1 Tax=Octopus vulgaris TaxID=6645 RepID=A0AA36ALS9_OCTVU|nr:Hypothetical predicted protein [Octopus vulgaris]